MGLTEAEPGSVAGGHAARERRDLVPLYVPAARSLAILGLILTFSAVMTLIADLDRPREGSLRVSQQAMIDLQELV